MSSLSGCQPPTTVGMLLNAAKYNTRLFPLIWPVSLRSSWALEGPRRHREEQKGGFEGVTPGAAVDVTLPSSSIIVRLESIDDLSKECMLSK
jgi:hypothetical protein